MSLRGVRLVKRANRVVVEHGLGGDSVSLRELAADCGFRVDRICQRLGISGRHFQRIFQAAMAMGPKEWLRAERMVAARHRLREGDSVKEVAMDLGYSQTATFSREFMMCYGVPPTTFVQRSAVRPV